MEPISRKFRAEDTPWLSGAALIGVAVCAYVGYLDQGKIGAVVGGMFGWFAGSLVGYCLSLLAEALLGSVDDDRPGFRVGLLRRITGRLARSVMRLVQLAFMLAICHELLWAVRFQTLSTNHHLGTRLAGVEETTDDVRALRRSLHRRRWLVATSASRPVSWCLNDDYLESNITTLKMVDWLTTAPIHVSPPSTNQPVNRPGNDDDDTLTIPPGMLRLVAYRGRPESRPAVVVNGEPGSGPPLTIDKLHELGQEICRSAELTVQDDLPRTLLLRFLSPDVVLMKKDLLPGKPRYEPRSE
jgi:hypothetical protein